MPAMVEVHQDNFMSEVQQSRVSVLLAFYAPWCPHCRAMMPVLDQMGGRMGERLKIALVNVDEQEEVREQFNINSVPSLFWVTPGEAPEPLPQEQVSSDLVGLVDRRLQMSMFSGQ